MNPKFWRHKKRDTLYVELGRAELQVSTYPGNVELSEGAVLVVYQGVDGKLWVRTEAEFNDGRFEEVE